MPQRGALPAQLNPILLLFNRGSSGASPISDPFPPPYGDHFRVEKDDMESENTYYWNVNVE